MALWLNHVTIKHFLTDDESHAAVQESMKNIADECKKHDCFRGFNFKKFYEIPAGDDVISPQDYANKLLDQLYDFADANRIWLG